MLFLQAITMDCQIISGLLFGDMKGPQWQLREVELVLRVL